MSKKIIVLASVMLVSLLCLGDGHAGTVRIGVLAKNGPEKALKKWKATGDYLTSRLNGDTFEIVPLGFDAVYPAIEKGQVDFFLVNSSMFVTAKKKYGARAILTMINSRQGKALKSFGGVIFTLIDNDKVNTLADVKGKTFAAVKETSFGGWQMAYKVFRDAGIDPYKDFASVTFSGKHINVVDAVFNEAIEVGTVRTDTLERLAAVGAVSMEDFKILNKQDHKDFPFVCSTALYPEWPLAKLAKTDDALARKVADALKGMEQGDPAAKAAKILGWTDPLDYAPVENLQKTLKIGAFAQ